MLPFEMLQSHIAIMCRCSLYWLCRWHLLNGTWKFESSDLILKTKWCLPKYTVDYLWLIKEQIRLSGCICSLTELPLDSLSFTWSTVCNRCFVASTLWHSQVFNSSPSWFAGFSVNASSERLNMGEIETLEDYWACANQLAFPASVNHGFSIWTPYSPPCVVLCLAVNHRINHLRLLPLAPANPFCPGLHRRCSYCQPAQVDFVQSPGRVGVRLSQQGWIGQQAFTVLWFILLTYLGKKNQLGFCKALLPSPGYSYHIQHMQSYGEREIEWEFVVNKCWSKPKCHRYWLGCSIRARGALLARSCIHKLPLETGNRRGAVVGTV